MDELDQLLTCQIQSLMRIRLNPLYLPSIHIILKRFKAYVMVFSLLITTRRTTESQCRRLIAFNLQGQVL